MPAQTTLQVSRRDVALSPHLWLMFVAMLALFSAAAFGLGFVMPEVDPSRLWTLSAGVAFAAIVLGLAGRPRAGSVQVHLVLMLVYLGPACGMVAFAPHGSAVAGLAVFVGPLIALWLVDRRQIAIHLVGSTVVLFLPSIFGLVDGVTFVACLALVPAGVALAVCCVLVTEAAEAQGERLSQASQRDPLTGVGNRRFLEKRLTQLIEQQAVGGATLSVLAFDLNGFKALNDRAGHDAGDALLKAVARVLRAHSADGDVVARQGGDEFCMVLSGAGPAEARARGEAIRTALARPESDRGAGVTTGIGVAVYPDDGTAAGELLDVADARLLDDKRAMPPAAPLAANAPAHHLSVVPVGATADDLYEPPASARWASRGVTRRELTQDRGIWLMNGLMYEMFALIGMVVLLVAPQYTQPEFRTAAVIVVAFGALVGVAHLVARPPALGSVMNHLVVASTYVLPALVLVTCQPGGSVGIGAAIFIGPLAAVRLSDRRQILAHLALASVLVLALIPSGAVNTTTTVAILLLVATVWALGVCVMFLMEAVERQGRQLARLAVTDPLTRAANRRGLAEFLAGRLGHGRGTITVVALDLNGFKQLNDRLGHAAGDDLLKAAAHVLSRESGPEDLVARLGGDEFCVVMPDASSDAVGDFVVRAGAALLDIDADGAALTSGFGTATHATASTSVDRILSAADADLIASKSMARVRTN